LNIELYDMNYEFL